jgi:zinc transport system substrate-binding protein
MRDVCLQRANGWLFLLLRTLLIGTMLIGCQPAEDPKPATVAVSTASPEVYAVNYPLAWMAERIGGDAIRVVFPAPEGIDPAHWQPTPETILNYQGADLVLLNGAGYAGWIQFAALSPGKLVDTSRGLSARFVSVGGATHSHGPKGEHDHGDVASQTWLDPSIASAQARAVADALEPLVSTADAAFERLQADLANLDSRVAAAFAGWADAGVLYSHPVYQYLDARYGLNGRSVSWEPDEDPGDTEWQRLAGLQRDRAASVMLWEGEPLPATAAKLSDLGIATVVFETGARVPTEGDYLTLMQRNIERISSISSINPVGGEHNQH